MGSYLCSEDSVHGQNVHLLGDTKGRRDLRTQDVGSRELGQRRAFASRSVEDSLVRHVASGSRRDKEDFAIRSLEDSILQGRSDKAVGLTIPGVSIDTRFARENSHCLGSQSRSHHIDGLASYRLQQVARGVWSPFKDFHLDSSVFLGADRFTTLSIVIHTRLVILRRVYGVSFTKLDFALFSQNVHLPSDKRVVVRVRIG